ncbi:MAG: 1-deoxy-D-xylulose-5-phosphate synthase, partial [Acidobacteria bacterium]|nr:1-deoxy-D-xylulose-5-phosphate synthase [Acidobacteriota bacterium]
IDLGLVDAYRVKPINPAVLARVLRPYERVVTLEEHFLSGGLGSALLESMADAGLQRPVRRIGIADRYYCENGGRAYLHRLAGLDVPTVIQSVLAFAKRESCPATS